MRRRRKQDDGDDNEKGDAFDVQGPKTLLTKHNAIRVSFLIVPIMLILYATTCTSLEKDAGEEMMGLNEFTETGLGETTMPSSDSSSGCQALRDAGITSEHLLWFAALNVAIWCLCPCCSLKTSAGSTLNLGPSKPLWMTTQQQQQRQHDTMDVELGSVPTSSVSNNSISSSTTTSNTAIESKQ